MKTFLLSLLFSTAALATPGIPFVNSGGFAKSFLPQINLANQCYLISGTLNPSTTAVSAPECSIYLSTNGNLYVKQDAGSSTNWNAASFSAGGVNALNTLTGSLTIAAGTGISVTPSGSTITIADTTTPGANTALSNLASTAVNVDIVPAADLGANLGASGSRYLNLYGQTLHATSFVAPSGNTFTFPTVDGSSGQALQTNGSGTLSFGGPYASFLGSSTFNIITPNSAVAGLTGSPTLNDYGTGNPIVVYQGHLVALWPFSSTATALQFWNPAGTKEVSFTAPTSIAASVNWTWPNADGTNGQAMSSNGSGVLGWTSYLKAADHVDTTGTTPTIFAGTCGTSPSISGNDSAGFITVGTGGTATSCTVVFNSSWSNTPACVASSSSTTNFGPFKVSPSTANVAIATTAALQAGSTIFYICNGFH